MKLLMIALCMLFLSTLSFAEVSNNKCDEQVNITLTNIDTSQFCVADSKLYSIGNIITTKDDITMTCDRAIIQGVVQQKMLGWRVINGMELAEIRQ